SYEEKTVDFYSDYLLYSKYLIFPALFLASYRCLLNSLEDTRIFYWAAAVAVSLNIVLNIILVHGVSIIPAMGVKGAGLATFIVNVIGFLIVHLYLKVKYDLKFKHINPFLANIVVVFNILRKGGPAGIQQILEGGLFTCVMIMMGYFSSNWLAATSVIFSILEITFVISLGISEVASAKLSQWISSGRLLESKLLVNSTFSLVIIVMFLLSVVFYFYPSIVVSVFISSKENENAFSVTMWMLSIVAFFMIFDGLQVSGIYILRGMHETIKSLVISIFCYWIVGLGSGLLFAFIFDLGPKGIFFGFCLGLLTSGLSLVYMSYKFLRITYRV
ncbi:MATE family efflux transporter, partial [Marinomonas spartinae]|uniref:MATE family efflux transporter n=1 Tax=Marinomonas spartinae TaxID=1792290 RepID=UPI0018F19489